MQLSLRNKNRFGWTVARGKIDVEVKILLFTKANKKWYWEYEIKYLYGMCRFDGNDILIKQK